MCAVQVSREASAVPCITHTSHACLRLYGSIPVTAPHTTLNTSTHIQYQYMLHTYVSTHGLHFLHYFEAKHNCDQGLEYYGTPDGEHQRSGPSCLHCCPACFLPSLPIMVIYIVRLGESTVTQHSLPGQGQGIII